MICLHLRVKQSQSFLRIRHFTLFPQPYHAVCTLLPLPSPSISNWRLFTWLSFSVRSFPELVVSQLRGAEGCGCVSVLFWDCACMWWTRTWSLVFSSHEREWGCNWDSWGSGSQLWEWRCWQGEVMPVLSGVILKMLMCCQNVSSLHRSDEHIQSLG